MKDKVLFVVTSHGELGDTGRKTGYFLSEVTHPWSVLIDYYDIDVVSPKGGKPPVDGFDLSDPINKKYWDDPQWQEKMSNTMTPDQVNPAEYKAIFYAGGHGAMWDFPNNEALAKIAEAIYGSGGLIAAVCHGPAGLLPIRTPEDEYFVKGKKLTGFTNPEEYANGTAKIVPFMLETALENEGAIFEEGGQWADHVVVDGRLLTGQNPMSALSLGKAILKALQSQTS